MKIKRVVSGFLLGLTLMGSMNVFADTTYHQSDLDKDGSIGVMKIYKEDNVDENGVGDYLIEIRMEEGWKEGFYMVVDCDAYSNCESYHDPNYKTLGDVEYKLRAVGADLYDRKNLGSQFFGRVTTPKEGGIIEIKMTVCSECTCFRLNESLLRIYIAQDEKLGYNYKAVGSLYFRNALPISERLVYNSTFSTTINTVNTIDTIKPNTNNTIFKVGKNAYTSNDRVMAGLREAGEALGSIVDWDATNKQVILTTNNTTLKLPLNSQYALSSSGDKIDLGAKTEQKNGVTYVPVGSLGRLLNANVTWDSVNQQAVISKN